MIKNTLEKRFRSVDKRIAVKEDDIYKVLKRMKPNIASGPEGVASSVLKLCAD